MPNYLAAGDILITDKPGVGHAGVAVFDTDMFDEGIVTLMRNHGQPVRANAVAHAVMGGGIEITYGWHQRSKIFRPKTLDLAFQERIYSVAKEMQAATRYGMARAVLKSWSRSSRFSTNAATRLQKYRDRMANHQGNMAIVKNVYCSEFVVLCYQLACANEDDPRFINKNAKHTLPLQLKAWLDKHSADWKRIGVTPGDDSLEYDAVA
jgi:hypothetical protein